MNQPTQYGPYLTSVLSYLNHYRLIPFNRLKQLTQDIFKETISQAILMNMTKQFYQLLEATETSISKNLLASNYLYLHETGCYFNGNQRWLQVTSNKRYTHYFVDEKLGSKVMNTNRTLPSFKGTVIHDYWTPSSNTRTLLMSYVMFTT